jgi:PAS domain S-box-containing protein
MTKSLRILIVEDSEEDTLLIVRQIEKRGYTVHWRRVETGKDMRSALKNQEWDIILSDYSLPGFNGMEALRIFQNCRTDIPFILISGRIGEATAVEAMKAGAHDYIIKDTLARLVPSIERELREAENRRARRRMENEIREKNEDMALLNQLNHMANAGDSLKSILFVLSRKGKKLFSSFGLTVYLLDRTQKYLNLQHPLLSLKFKKLIEQVVGMKIPAEIRIPLTVHSMYKKILDGRKTVIIREIKEIEKLVLEYTDSPKIQKLVPKICKIMGIKSVVHFPLMAGEEVLGILDLSRNSDFKESEIRRMEVFAGQITALVKRKEAEEEIHRSEERYRVLLGTSPDSITVTDLAGNITDVSEQSLKLHGLENEGGLIGRNALELIAPEDRERATANLRRTFQEGSVRNIEYTLIKKDGSRFIGELNAALIKDGRGEPEGFLATVRDITEHKRAGEALRASEARYRTLAESAQESIFIINRNYQIEYVNPFGARLLGGDPEAFINKKLSGLFPDSYFKRQKKNLREVFETGNAVYIEDASVFQNRELWLGTRLVPLKNPAGEVENILGIARDNSERKAAEEALRVSEEKFRILFELSPYSMVYSDLNGNILACNRQFVHLHATKKGPEEQTGRNVSEFFPEKEHERLFSIIKKTIDSEKNLGQFEFTMLKEDRTHFQAEANSTVIKDKNGKPIALLALAIDITERKMAEAALKKSEDKYRTLTNNLNVGVYRNTTGPYGRFIEANPAIIDMFGYRRKKEFLQLNVSDLYHCSEERKTFNEKMLQEGFVRNEELQLHKKDGTVFIGSVSAVSVKDKNGKVKYYDGIIEDITKRKQAEQALRDTEERYHTLFERVPDGIYRSTQSGKFVDVNPSLVKIFGYDSKEELLSIDIKSQLYVDPEDRDRGTEEEKETGIATVRLRRKDGSVIWIEDRGYYIYGDDGEILYHEGILRDVTKRKEIEENMKASLKEKEILLKEIHHRVKNNMQVISSLLSLQAYRLKNKKALQMFNESRDRVRSMALVHEKLYQSEDFTRINFTEYIRSLTSHLYRSYEIDPGRIALTLNIGSISPSIELAVPCGLVLNELISNALKYAFPANWSGRGRITVSFQNKGNGKLELVVKDNGVGLHIPTDLSDIQSLGLHLVNILVKDQLQGSITMHSNKGTTFCIRFSENV